jgi:hypothetical protein
VVYKASWLRVSMIWLASKALGASSRKKFTNNCINTCVQIELPGPVDTEGVWILNVNCLELNVVDVPVGAWSNFLPLCACEALRSRLSL